MKKINGRQDSHDGSQKNRAEQVPCKQPYSTPRLREYGSLAKLTQNNIGSIADSGTGMMSGACL